MSLKKTLVAAQQSLPVDFMKKIGATNIQLASERSLRFDLPATATGVNRVKVTLQINGEWRLRTYKVEELEDVPGIAPDSLVGAINALVIGGQ